jgi:hypothetical protein
MISRHSGHDIAALASKWLGTGLASAPEQIAARPLGVLHSA